MRDEGECGGEGGQEGEGEQGSQGRAQHEHPRAEGQCGGKHASSAHTPHHPTATLTRAHTGMGAASSSSVEVPGGGHEGYHVLRVQHNSPGSRAGLEPYFDFILSINGARLVCSLPPSLPPCLTVLCCAEPGRRPLQDRV